MIIPWNHDRSNPILDNPHRVQQVERMSSQVWLLESTMSRAGQPLKVDREKGVIAKVKILGEESANPPPNANVYPRTTRENAARLMEGARTYVNHSPRGAEGQTRDYGSAMGVHRNIREEGDGLYSDFHFNPKHPLAEQLCWDAEHCPELVGFSISSVGRGVQRDGKHLIEEIMFDRAQHSIDLVSRPATTKGLREALEQPMKYTVKHLIESLAKKRPGYVKALREEVESGIMTPEYAMDDPGETPAAGGDDADHEVALKAGFRGAIVAVLDDESLDMKGKLSKIKEIMKAEEKLIGGGKEPEADGGGTGEDEGIAAAAESRKGGKVADGTKRLEESFNLRLKARDLCSEAKVVPGKVLLKALDACTSEAEVKSLIEEARGQQPAPLLGPKSAAPWGNTDKPAAGSKTPLQESMTFAGDSQADAQTKRLAALRGGR